MKENLFECRKVFHNLDIKFCTASEITNASKYQLLCIVTCKDEIILRYVSDTSEIILKKIDWFCDKKKIIQHVSFDSNPSAWLLVLCVDNTVIIKT